MFVLILYIAENSIQQSNSVTLNGLITIGISSAVITDLSFIIFTEAAPGSALHETTVTEPRHWGGPVPRTE